MNRPAGLNANYGAGITGWKAPHLRVQNSQFLIDRNIGIIFNGNSHDDLRVDNCLVTGGIVLQLNHGEPVKSQISRSAVMGALELVLMKRVEPPIGERGSKPYQVESLSNIFETPTVFRKSAFFSESDRLLTASEAQHILTQMVAWREKDNLYAFDERDLLELRTQSATSGAYVQPAPTVPLKTPKDLQRFWGAQEIDSRRGLVRFQGEDQIAALRGRTPELLTPHACRLRPASAGSHAGPAGKDMGPHSDLVGPGPAYERWKKKTPDYQQWLRDTGQLK